MARFSANGGGMLPDALKRRLIHITFYWLCEKKPILLYILPLALRSDWLATQMSRLSRKVLIAICSVRHFYWATKRRIESVRQLWSSFPVALPWKDDDIMARLACCSRRDIQWIAKRKGNNDVGTLPSWNNQSQACLSCLVYCFNRLLFFRRSSLFGHQFSSSSCRGATVHEGSVYDVKEWR